MIHTAVYTHAYIPPLQVASSWRVVWNSGGKSTREINVFRYNLYDGGGDDSNDCLKFCFTWRRSKSGVEAVHASRLRWCGRSVHFGAPHRRGLVICGTDDPI